MSGYYSRAPGAIFPSKVTDFNSRTMGALVLLHGLRDVSWILRPDDNMIAR